MLLLWRGFQGSSTVEEKKNPLSKCKPWYGGRIYTILIKPASSLAQEEGEKNNQEKKVNITNCFRYQPLQHRETRSINCGPLQ